MSTNDEINYEPLLIVKKLPLELENYKHIWNQLIERNDNKRQLATSYFKF